MSENVAALMKHTTPTRYDTAPYGTLWALTGGHKDRIWVQTSEDMDRMDWQEMPDFLGNVFEQFYHNKNFVDDCLMILKNKREQKENKIRQIVFSE